jgi:hypothetical protein
MSRKSKGWLNNPHQVIFFQSWDEGGASKKQLSEIQIGKALFDYNARTELEISLKVGDEVVIVDVSSTL